MAGLDLDLNAKSRWTEAMRPLFASFQSDLGLARRLALPNPKSEAGYLGQFRRGEQRGLVHFLHNEERLRRLEDTLGNPGLKAILKRCLVAEAVDRLYYAPGFEDLGPLPWNRYVPPPLLMGSVRVVSPNDGQQSLVESLNKGLLLSHNRDLWAAAKAWAVADGWRLHEWEPGGRLPNGRAELLVLKGLRGPTELNEWCKAEGHGVLAMGIPAQHSLTTCQPQSANLDWLTALLESLYDVVEPRLLRRLKRLKGADLEELVQAHPEPTSRELGIRLRALAEERADTPGSSLLISAAERRLEKPGALAGVDELLPGVLLASWEPNVDLIGLFQREAVAQAQAVIDDLKGPQRRILERALPYLDGQAVWTRLKAAGLVRTEPPSIESEIVGLLAKEAAVLVLSDPKAMKHCMLAKQHQVLHWVMKLPNGPEQVAKVLKKMGPAAFHVAVEDVPAWLSELRWTGTLVARFIAVLVQLQAIGKAKPIKADVISLQDFSASVLTARHTRIGSLLSNAPLPSHAAIRKALAWYHSGLGRQAETLEDDQIAFYRALLVPNKDDLSRPSVWNQALQIKLDLSSWSNWLLLSPSNAELAFDLSSPVGRTLARHNARLLDREVPFPEVESPLRNLWLRALTRVFDHRPSFVGDVLAKCLGYLRTDWEPEQLEETLGSPFGVDPVEGLLSAITYGALQLRGRHRRQALEPLQEELERLLDDRSDPAFICRQAALGRLLQSVLTRRDCSGRLVTANLEVHHYWEALSWGCSAEEIVELRRRVLSGEISASPETGFYDGTKHQLEEALLRAAFERVTSTDAIRTLGPDSAQPAPLDWLKRSHRTLAQRALAWSFHQDLSEDDIIWSILGKWKVLHLTNEWAELKEWSEQPKLRPDSDTILSLDRPHVLQLAELLPNESKREKWVLLVGQTLRVGLEPDAHFKLLDRVADRFSDLMGALLLRALKLDNSRARRWLEERLRTDLESVDVPLMRVPLQKAELPATVLEAALKAQDTPCGEALLAFVHAKQPDLKPWLALNHTRVAATQLLVRSGLEAPGVLRSLESLGEAPSKEVLRALLQKQGSEDLALLAEASSTWPLEPQRTLWLRVAEVASAEVASEALARVAWMG